MWEPWIAASARVSGTSMPASGTGATITTFFAGDDKDPNRSLQHSRKCGVLRIHRLARRSKIDQVPHLVRVRAVARTLVVVGPARDKYDFRYLFLFGKLQRGIIQLRAALRWLVR